MSEIQSDDEKRCSKAAIKLAEYGPEAKEAIPNLIEIVQNQEMNLYAMSVLLHISTEESIERILQLADDENPLVSSLAIECLKLRELDQEKALAIYTELLNHDNPFVSLEAAQALHKVGEGRLCIDRILQLAHDKDATIKGIAVSTIGEIGIANDKVKRVLSDCFSTPDKLEWVKAASIYHKLYPEERKGLERLQGLLKDEDKNVRWRTAKAIGDLKSIDPQTIQLISKSIDDENGQVVMWACYAMIRHNADKERAWKLVINILESEDQFAKLSAVNVLLNLGPVAKGQQRKLVEMLDDNDVLVQILVINALGKIQPSKELALPALENIVKTTDDFIIWNISKRSIKQITTSDCKD